MKEAFSRDEKCCRICYLDDGSEDLCSPCKCSGSVQYVHAKCLIRWLKIPSGKCELCGHAYAVKKTVKPYDQRQYPCIEKCKSLKIIKTILLMDWIHFGEMTFLFSSLCVLNSFKSVDLLYQVGLIVAMEFFYYTIQFTSCVMFLYYKEWCVLNMDLTVMDYNTPIDQLTSNKPTWLQWGVEWYIHLIKRTQNIMQVIESVLD